MFFYANIHMVFYILSITNQEIHTLELFLQ
jgi:hypothetical protein